MKAIRLKDLFFIGILFSLCVLIACGSDNTDAEEEQKRIADSLAQSALDSVAINAYIEAKGITGITKEDTGIKYALLNPGGGTFPQFNEIISIHYVGRFLTDSVFDTSNQQTALDHDIFNSNALYQPITFNYTPDGVGLSGAFLPQFRVGLNRLVPQMDLGAKAILLMPSAAAYGTTGDVLDPSLDDNIPPNTPILFEFTLVNIRN